MFEVISTRLNNILNLLNDFIKRKFLISVFSTFLIFMLLGIITSYLLKLTMNKDAWFWIFSSIPQTFSSFVAILAVFLMSRLELYKKDKENILHLLEDMKIQNRSDILTDIHFKSFNNEQKLNKEYIIDWAKEIIIKNPRYPNNPIYQRLINEFYAMNIKIEKAKELMKRSLLVTSLIILSSIFLLPLGSVNIENRFLLILLNYHFLKWGFVYGIVGLCFAALYHIILSLRQLLFEKD